jgi:hypothetical protein
MVVSVSSSDWLSCELQEFFSVVTCAEAMQNGFSPKLLALVNFDLLRAPNGRPRRPWVLG